MKNPRQEEIEELIKKRGLKKTYLANLLGVTKQNIDYHLSKTTDLDDQTYERFLTAIDPERSFQKTIERMTREAAEHQNYLLKLLSQKEKELSQKDQEIESLKKQLGANGEKNRK